MVSPRSNRDPLSNPVSDLVDDPVGNRVASLSIAFLNRLAIRRSTLLAASQPLLRRLWSAVYECNIRMALSRPIDARNGAYGSLSCCVFLILLTFQN